MHCIVYVLGWPMQRYPYSGLRTNTRRLWRIPGCPWPTYVCVHTCMLNLFRRHPYHIHIHIWIKQWDVHSRVKYPIVVVHSNVAWQEMYGIGTGIAISLTWSCWNLYHQHPVPWTRLWFDSRSEQSFQAQYHYPPRYGKEWRKKRKGQGTKKGSKERQKGNGESAVPVKGLV